MKVAVLSDIHGNHVALEACVKEIEKRGIRTLIFLGDYLGELAYPGKTMEYLRKLSNWYECYFVKGNKEDYWIEYEKSNKDAWREYDSTTGALYYVYERLTAEDMEFYKSLSYFRRITFAGLPTIALYHGSHDASGKKISLHKENMDLLLGDNEEALVLCGHTHRRHVIEQDGRKILNPGAVGVPIDSEGMSQFAILTGENGEWSHEFVDVRYDVDQVIEELKEEELFEKAPCWSRVTEQLLRGGNVSHAKVLAKAMQLLYADTGEWRWPGIPEPYWELAVEELIPA